MALEEIVEKINEADIILKTQTDEEHEKKNTELTAAQELRDMACETFGETLKRKGPDTDKEIKKKSRSSGSDTMIYLKDKAEREQEYRNNELELRKQELELRKKELENTQNQQVQMFSAVVQQLQVQNQQMFSLVANLSQNKH